jgi:hypothetical protein
LQKKKIILLGKKCIGGCPHIFCRQKKKFLSFVAGEKQLWHSFGDTFACKLLQVTQLIKERVG